MDVEVPSAFSMLLDGILHPFFIFQIFSCLLWLIENYMIYAVTILVMTIVSLVLNLIQTRDNIKAVRALAHYECNVKVFRGDWQEINSKDLIPGDIIDVAEGKMLPCDLVLLTGLCLVDESMLTGESQLVVKDYMPRSKSVYFHKEKKFTLSAGTLPKICKDKCIGMVIATGFNTAKGELVRSILFPKPNRFSFYSDSFKFIGILAGVAVLGFIWSSAFLITNGESTFTVIIRSLDLITIVIPPVLPLVLSIGTSFSIYRLKQLKITCISLPAVNAAGRVSVVVFDKTGTITEDWMVLKGVIIDDEIIGAGDISYEFQENMCTCNSLTYIRNEIQGDPQEIAIFESTSWIAVESEYRWTAVFNEKFAHVIQVYHFSSESKRMGVVVKNDKGLFLHMKGAPEMILKLCEKVPDRIEANIEKYTKDGYRVMACGYKKLESYDPDLGLEQLEKGLTYLGVFILVNPLKSDSADTIRTLQAANIRCVISTGDAHLTGISVAKICSIVPTKIPLYIGELTQGKLRWRDPTGRTGFLPKKCCIAVTGDILEYMVKNKHPDIQKVIECGAVFGRMFPHQKILLIELLQEGDTMVGMVGDGANDCGALKIADVGLSLSKAEASIAAPFSTSDIKGIVHVLKEGRAALVTSLQSFKFVAMYSMIQFTCVCMLYSLKNNLMDTQFLYQDMVIILPISISMAHAGPYYMLAPELPPGALFSFTILGSLSGQIVFQILGQIGAYLLLLPWDWYEAKGDSAESPIESVENTTLFIVACFQLLIIGIVFNIGPPYRRATVENFWFTGITTFIILITVYLLMVPEVIGDWFEVIDLQTELKWLILALIFVNLTCAYYYEKYFLPKMDDRD